MNQDQQLREALIAGWKMAAQWANRDDLISDIGSPAFELDADAHLLRIAALTATQQAAPSRVAEACFAISDELRKVAKEIADNGHNGWGNVCLNAAALLEASAQRAQPAEHDLYTDADQDRPNVICDSNGQVVLNLCKRCGKGEAELEGRCEKMGQPAAITQGQGALK